MSDNGKFLFGVVTWFNRAEKYGFIRVRGWEKDFFFHLNDGLPLCIEGGRVDFNRSSSGISREPKAGEKVVFELAEGSRGRPKASPWGFRHGLHESFDYWLAILAGNPSTTPVSPFRQKTGFVCPPWALSHWRRSECTIEATTDANQHVILDHSIQTVVFAGTLAECRSFLGPDPGDSHDEEISGYAMLPNQEVFHSGDSVIWRQPGPVMSFVIEEFGQGPFKVKGVRPVPPASRQDAAHSQFVLIDELNNEFSGAFFTHVGQK